jgi:hypothetical protein
MLPNKYRHAGSPAGVDNLLRAVQGVGDRLLHKNRDAGGDALQRTLDMQLIRGGENHAVRSVGAKQFRK